VTDVAQRFDLDLLDGEVVFEVDVQAAYLFKHPPLAWTTSMTCGPAIHCSTRQFRQRTGSCAPRWPAGSWWFHWHLPEMAIPAGADLLAAMRRALS